VRKLRLTGGEPLLRHGLPTLVAMLAEIPDVDIAVTTNGSLLADQAQALADAGLHRATVSLDSLDDAVFRSMNDVAFPVARVLEGVAAAEAAGLTPLKINAVVRRGVNDHTVVDLARHFKGSGHIVRFIEFMDVGTSNGWRVDDVVAGSEVVRMIHAEMPLEPVESSYRGEVARRGRYADGGGEIGVITSVTQPFCGDCTRARISPKAPSTPACSRRPARPPPAAARRERRRDRGVIEAIWRRAKTATRARSQSTKDLPRIEMSYIGG
jgi:cyclic pyranopterin phosphate synthase